MVKTLVKIILIAMVAFSLLTACEAYGYESSMQNNIDETPTPILNLTPTPTSQCKQASPPVETERFSTCDFLADLDYLVWVLENNFPFFNTAYWARGIDITQLAYDARRAIIDADEIDEDVFLYIMWHSFEPLLGIGHFQIVTPFNYQLLRAGLMGVIDGFSFIRLLNSPLVQSFYGTRVGDDFSFSEEWVSAVIELSITTIEEESIAIITIPGFWGTSEEAENKIGELYAQINDFRHLIIDIRGNSGGTPTLFVDSIMGPHIDSDTIAEMFMFLKDGEYITRYDGRQLSWGAPGRPTTEIFGSIDEILAYNDLSQAVADDIDRFAYAFSSNVYLRPLVGMDRVEFDGSIWMLVDEHVFSAAQYAAWIAKDTGFATLVGEITGGAYGGLRTYSVMPNTGIIFMFDALYITDRYGRPLEAGTIPHHFNRPGMDAMETVLALIAERDY